ncbi:MAG: DUF2796 domain-containing protein [Candidatus Thiodiazotropha sp. (ex Monitilora ramsayi)]|nr:DUF2796 domain-containing protein [Candidatus Thiodiazotropha sp. (ex Monitilora ramsayi)]
MFKTGIGFLSLSLLALSTPLQASESDHEQHESHVHGEAKLLIVLEENALEIEFLSPAMNIVGFEHQPKSEEQMGRLKAALETLNNPDLLFGLPAAAKCIIESKAVKSPMAVQDEHEEENHSDFATHYHYQCAETTRLNKIDIHLFDHFPATEAIEVQAISNRGQQKLDLTPGHSTLEL